MKKTRNERENVMTDTTEIQRKVINDYNEQLYAKYWTI